MLFKATMPAFLQSPINSGVIAMLAGLVIVPVVSLFTKAPDRSLVNDAFSCYDAKVLVHASQSLGGDETGE